MKTKYSNITTKITTKKFQLIRKYAYYPTRDEKQNAPLIQKIINPQQIFKKLLHEVLHEVYTKSEVNFKTSRLTKNLSTSVSTRKLI